MKSYRIRRLDVTASTNDDAVKAAEAGDAEGLVVHALRQTAGRGRHGRTWESPEGNLYCSILLRPTCEPQKYGQYSFMAALALGETVQECLPDAHVTLKWPNDVLVDGKKIGGILLESGQGYLVVGMGLNVHHHPENALYPSTCLGLSGGGVFDLDVILNTLLRHMTRWCDSLKTKDFAPLRAAWLKKAQKGRLTIKSPDESVEGDFIDIDGQGHLRLRLADGAERIMATGDVFYRGH
jgi:BirA family biotin operon repressor/biotin-[acetyl-CoA-carboxylase] ligase